MTGVGMATSLGLDAIMSCAAARAGMSGGKKLERFPVQSSEDNSSSLLVGHALPEVTRGFEGWARLLRIVQAGLSDLLAKSSDRLGGERRIGLYVAVPDPLRVYEGIAWIEDPEERAARQQALDEAGRSEPSPSIRLIEKALAICAPAFHPAGTVVWQGDGTTALRLLELAAREISAGAMDAAIVGGIDSLIDADYIEWLAAVQRLKTPDRPVGLQPGEGAGFVLIEDSRVLRGARPLAFLGDVAVADEANPWTSTVPSTGRALTEIIRRAQVGAPVGDAPPWTITDHNGETYRAAEWGNALPRLISGRRVVPGWTAWFPALSFGDTGAASPLLGLGMAVRAFARNYNPGPAATIVATSTGPARNAVSVDSPGVG